jgi:hypothetical protein
VRILDRLFMLRVSLAKDVVLAVAVYDVDQFSGPNGRRIYDRHHAITWRARVVSREDAGKRRVCTIWKPGQQWVGIPEHATTDGRYAKEAVLSSLGMRPGDTDAEYFEGWNERQLDFANRYGQIISCEREQRYCDSETGFLR